MKSDNRRITHSQNFIKHRQLVEELLDLADISHNDTVIEIGPGRGIITVQLLQRAAKVIAIEQDEKLANHLRNSTQNWANLELITADFMKWTLPSEDYKVFSNIPFNRTAEIVAKLVEADHPPFSAYLVMQKLAAQRFAGKPYSDESLMSILLKIDFETEILRSVSQAEFDPRPRVEISFVHFRRRNCPVIPSDATVQFRDLVTYCYTQWQPSVLDALKKVFTSKQLAIISKDVSLGVTPKQVDFEQWLILFDAFIRYANRDGKKAVLGAEQRLKKQQQSLEKLHRTRRQR